MDMAAHEVRRSVKTAAFLLNLGFEDLLKRGRACTPANGYECATQCDVRRHSYGSQSAKCDDPSKKYCLLDD